MNVDVVIKRRWTNGFWKEVFQTKAEKRNVVKNPGEVRAWTYSTKSPGRSEALHFIDSAESRREGWPILVDLWVHSHCAGKAVVFETLSKDWTLQRNENL